MECPHCDKTIEEDDVLICPKCEREGCCPPDGLGCMPAGADCLCPECEESES